MAFISDKDRGYIEEMFRNGLGGEINISLFVDPQRSAHTARIRKVYWRN